MSASVMNRTPAEQAKAEGLKSLTQVSKMTGQSLQTLSNWAKNKPQLFKIVLLGCRRIDAIGQNGNDETHYQSPENLV